MKRLHLRSAAAVALIGAGACDRATAPIDPVRPPARYDLVFESYAGTLSNQRELYRVHGTASPTPLFAAGTFGAEPSATPDGRWMVYLGSGLDETPDIWMVAADGSAAHKLFATSETELSPALSSSRTQVTFVKVDVLTGATSLWLANADGSQPRPLIASVPEANLGHGRAAWSPDGTRLVFSHGIAGQLDLYIGAPAATSFTRLTNTATSDVEASWSPDGRRIVFSRVTSPARSDLVILDVATMTETPLRLAGSNRQPAWSPDGTRIAFSSTLDGEGDHEIYTIAPDGTGLTRITRNDVNDRYPVWVRAS